MKTLFLLLFLPLVTFGQMTYNPLPVPAVLPIANGGTGNTTNRAVTAELASFVAGSLSNDVASVDGVHIAAMTPGQFQRALTATILTNSVMTETNGMVGIGPTGPEEKLSVNGNILFAGTPISGGSFGMLKAAYNGSLAEGIAATIDFYRPADAAWNDQGEIRFSTSNHGLGQRMVIDKLGNVGIGTTVPGARLTIKEDTVESYLSGLNIQRNNTLDTWGLVVGGDNTLYFGYATNASGADTFGDFAELFNISSAGNTTMAGNLTVSGTGNTTIAGNVGIGTNAPVTTLHVNGDSTFHNVLFETANIYDVGSLSVPVRTIYVTNYVASGLPGITTTWTNLISGIATNRITTQNGIVVTNVLIAW